MSGPKLLGITHDPEIIRMNNERLAMIGKNAYYGDRFKSMNVDIENEKKWVENYALDLISIFNDDIEEIKNQITQIESIKKRYINMLEVSKLNESLIDINNANELNKIVCNKIKMLPEIKQKLIKEISVKLRAIQEIIDRKKAEEIRRQQKIEADKKNEYNTVSEMAEKRSSAERTKVFQSIIFYDVENRNVKTVGLNEDLSLEELAIVENIAKEVNGMKDMSVITENDRRLIRIIFEELENINDKKKYSATARKNILEEMKMYFQMLDKNVAESISDMVEKNAYRDQLLYECSGLSEILNINVPLNVGITELETIRKDLQEKAAILEEKMYTQETITEVMKKYGYSNILTFNLNDYDKASKIIFENDGMKICASIGDGAMMLQVVGIGDTEPTSKEKEQQVRQQGAFCKIYPDIKSELPSSVG